MNKKTLISTALLFVFAVFTPCLYAQTAQELQVKADAGDAVAQVKLGTYYQDGCCGVGIDSVRAMQLFQQAAAGGNSEAKVYLSGYYIFSRLVPHDTLKCYTLRKEAADANCAHGIESLGSCYIHGYVVQKDTAKAVELYEQALKMGDPNAAYSMAWAYLYGEFNLKKDLEKSFKLLKQAFNGGSYYAGGLLAAFYQEKDNTKEAWNVINKGLEMNQVDCRVQAANFYAEGIGVARDERKALAMYYDVLQQCPDNEWAANGAFLVYISAEDLSLRDTVAAIALLEKSIASGGNNSNYLLGQIYYYSPGQYNDRNKALQYFLKGVKSNSDAYRMVGLMYILGDGIEVDTEKGLAFLKEGYDKKSPECANALGDAYCGMGDLQPDYSRALNYYEKAVEWRGVEADYESIYNLYNWLRDSVNALAVANRAVAAGITEGYYWKSQVLDMFGETKAAIKALKKGLSLGNESAGMLLARCYVDGFGLKQNYKKAVRIYEQLGTAEAKFYNAKLLLGGKIGNKTSADLQNAISLLQQSANGGYTDALYLLGTIYEVEDYGLQNIDVALGYFRRMAEEGNPEGYFKIGEYYEMEYHKLGGAEGASADSAKCIEYYQKAVDKNHAGAMCYLADFYKVGNLLPVDSAKAFALYSQAMALDYTHAYDHVARCYLNGVGVPVDSVKAVSYLRIAAAKGEGSAYAYLADFYSKGLASLPVNGDSALYYFHQGSKLDDPICDYNMGSFLQSQGLYDKALSYFYSAATNGNADAVVAVAQCLQDGTGIESDPKQAYQLFQYAAHQYGSADAYVRIGAAHIFGQGCAEDYALAKSYFDTAASMGSTIAFYNLGICYRDGIGCTVDSALSLQWFVQASEAGSVRAINELGDMYEAGEGVPQDFNKAVEYYRKGVEKYQSTSSMCNLGYCYEKGQGVVLNSAKAFELYNQAAEAGSARGMFLVANCYIEGISVQEDPVKAEEWLLKSAEQDYVLADYYLGIMYENGEEGVSVDKKKAIHYYSLAAKAGYEPAQAAIDKMKKRKK